MNNIKKDLILTLIIGEAAAWLMISIARNLSGENPEILVIMPYFKLFPFVFPVICLLGVFLAYLIGKIIPVIYQLAKFILVGGLNFLIDMGVLSFLIFATGISTGLIQSSFKALSFLGAVINSYLWNKHWTFKRKGEGGESISREFFQFLIVSIIGLSINVMADYIFVNTIGPRWGLALKTWAQFSAMIASAIAMIWNFLGYKFIVFDTKK